MVNGRVELDKIDYPKKYLPPPNGVTPQPNCSKVFELQQSNQGYGESLGVKEAQKNAELKYFIEPFWRNLILKFT